MSELSIVIIVLAVMLSGMLLRLLMPGKKSSHTAASTFRPNLADKLPTAKHFAYFPQIRQALSAADSQYLRNNAPPDVFVVRPEASGPNSGVTCASLSVRPRTNPRRSTLNANDGVMRTSRPAPPCPPKYV